MSIKVTVWNEDLDEKYFEELMKSRPANWKPLPPEVEAQFRERLRKTFEEIRSIYPEGIHGTLKRYLEEEKDFEVRTATLREPEHGLTEEVLNDTDVLIWWGHMAHDKVSDEVVDRIQKRVLSGMGLIVLHSGHESKIFKRLMGTTCSLKWREAEEKEILWVVSPNHPIVEGIGEYIELEHEEMYGEFFDIPDPDELVFLSWYKGGEVFRSGCCWTRGYGKVFYFSPGHETYPNFHNEKVLRVIKNAVRWAAPKVNRTNLTSQHATPIERLD